MNNTFRTIARNSEAVYTEKRSKFIAFAFPVQSVEQTKEHLDTLKKKYYDSRHICWAYMLGAQRAEYRANDDGEPSGTAGKPILGQINSKELTNILIAVVRYFGGIKLGTGGLVVAYKEAALASLNEAEIIEEIVTLATEFSFDYLQMNDVMKAIKDSEAKIIEQHFDLNCRITLQIPQAEYKQLITKLENITSLTFLDDEVDEEIL